MIRRRARMGGGSEGVRTAWAHKGASQGGGAKRALEGALELEPPLTSAARTCARKVGMSLQLYDDSDDDQ